MIIKANLPLQRSVVQEVPHGFAHANMLEQAHACAESLRKTLRIFLLSLIESKHKEIYLIIYKFQFH